MYVYMYMYMYKNQGTYMQNSTQFHEFKVSSQKGRLYDNKSNKVNYCAYPRKDCPQIWAASCFFPHLCTQGKQVLKRYTCCVAWLWWYTQRRYPRIVYIQQIRHAEIHTHTHIVNVLPPTGGGGVEHMCAHTQTHTHQVLFLPILGTAARYCTSSSICTHTHTWCTCTQS